MKDLYINRKLSFCSRDGFVSLGCLSDVPLGMRYTFVLYERNTTPKHLSGGIFEVYEIERYDKLIEGICNSTTNAILSSRHSEDFIRKLCEYKLHYKRRIEIYYEEDYI